MKGFITAMAALAAVLLPMAVFSPGAGAAGELPGGEKCGKRFSFTTEPPGGVRVKGTVLEVKRITCDQAKRQMRRILTVKPAGIPNLKYSCKLSDPTKEQNGYRTVYQICKKDSNPKNKFTWKLKAPIVEPPERR